MPAVRLPALFRLPLRAIHWLAVFAVVLHVGLLVRHNSHALSIHFADALEAHAIVCGDARPAAPVHAPVNPAQTCPICMGAIGSLTVLADAPPTLRLPVTHLVRFPDYWEQLTVVARLDWPPNRGPPRAA